MILKVLKHLGKIPSLSVLLDDIHAGYRYQLPAISSQYGFSSCLNLTSMTERCLNMHSSVQATLLLFG